MTERQGGVLPENLEPEDRTPSEHLEPDERDIEAPSEDALEQATLADPAELPEEIHRGLEVPEADALDQARVVEFGDDAYR
jgi:hypothetical protein